MIAYGLRTALTVSAAAILLAGCGDVRGAIGSPASGFAGAPGADAGSVGKEQVLYSFTGGNDGGNAATSLVVNAGGALFGTTVVGGGDDCGTAFKLTPRNSAPWGEAVLYDFTCGADGKNPHGGMTFDPRGDLLGTTVAGGSGGACAGDGCGVVFRLRARTETVVHDFTGGKDGFGPGSAVAFDSTRHAYGTTPDGGAYSQGVVYELSPMGARWRERVIHAFTGGTDGGVGSLGPLLVDTSRNLYGVTEIGGAHGAGIVYRMTPKPLHAWKFTVLYAFQGTPDAGSPYGGVIADASGNLFGTTYYGGANGLGAVYELVKNARGGYRERVLYSFHGGSDGSSPTSTLLLTGSTLYGTTSAGGNSCDCGTIFKVNANTGNETVLHRFGNRSDGAYPYYGLTPGSSGNLYGTTVAGGTSNQGTVFEYTP